MNSARSFALAALAAGLVAAPAARAEPVDMSTVTCAHLMSMSTDEMTFMLSWVAGYVAGTAEELSLDPDVLGKTVQDTVTYCQANQEMSVLNAIKESAAN